MNFPGRGAFTKVGKDNLESLYVYVPGKPMDGATPSKGLPDSTGANNYRAVNLGVKGYQKRLNELFQYGLVVDGVLGPASDRAIKDAKKRLLGSTNPTGKIGPTLSRKLWAPVVTMAEGDDIPDHLLCGLMMQESAGDNGAVGAATPHDKGLFQYNLDVHSYTEEQAFDPSWSAVAASARMIAARKLYAGKGTELQDQCSVLQHNSPVWAKSLYLTGVFPTPTALAYVTHVFAFASTF